ERNNRRDASCNCSRFVLRRTVLSASARTRDTKWVITSATARNTTNVRMLKGSAIRNESRGGRKKKSKQAAAIRETAADKAKPFPNDCHTTMSRHRSTAVAAF